MIQRYKDLLLKDICARLPYGVKLHINSYLVDKDDTLLGISLIEGLTPYIIHNKIISVHSGYSYSIEEVKPYLRPMSSMTKDEEEELRLLKNQLINCDENNEIKFYNIIDEIHKLYLSHYIDYRGLIKKGLALEAPEGMYKFS